MTTIKVIQRGEEFDVIHPDGSIQVTTIGDLVNQEVRNCFGEDATVEIVDESAPAETDQTTPAVPPTPEPTPESVAGPGMPAAAAPDSTAL